MEIQITIKCLNGDLLIVSHPENASMFSLFQKVYSARPEIPAGCLRLVPFQDDSDLTEEQELLRLGDLHLPDVRAFQGPVVDGDLLCAAVDTSLITVNVKCTGTHTINDPTARYNTHLLGYDVDFYTQDPDCDEAEFLSYVPFFHDEQKGFADVKTFLAPDYQLRQINTYVPTPMTIWYPTLAELIRHTHGVHPRTLDICEDAQRVFDEYTGEDPFGGDDESDWDDDHM